MGEMSYAVDPTPSHNLSAPSATQTGPIDEGHSPAIREQQQKDVMLL